MTALHAAPAGILIAATALQLVALVARSAAWAVCVDAAGGTVARRALFRAASLGYLGSQLNSQLGAAARIAALRRAGPRAGARGSGPLAGGGSGPPPRGGGAPGA